MAVRQWREVCVKMVWRIHIVGREGNVSWQRVGAGSRVVREGGAGAAGAGSAGRQRYSSAGTFVFPPEHVAVPSDAAQKSGSKCCVFIPIAGV